MPLKQRKKKKRGKKKKSGEDTSQSQAGDMYKFVKKAAVEETEEMEEHKDDKIVIKSFTDNEVEVSEHSVMPYIPFEVVEIIMKFCVGVEYMNFRATCKRCYQEAPLIHWSQRDEKALKRLQNYSLVSPWLMVVDKKLGNLTFTDPLSGDNYFMRNDSWIPSVHRICCSGFGWLLFNTGDYDRLVLYNPFTRDIRWLPKIKDSVKASSFCFSAPPTSPRCKVVGLAGIYCYVHTVGEQLWHEILVLLWPGSSYVSPEAFQLPFFYRQGIYGLFQKQDFLHVIKVENKIEIALTKNVAKAPTSCCKSGAPFKNFLTKWDQGLLLVMVSDESVQVFKLDDNTKEWLRIDGIGRHMIYISDTSCLCVEAKIREMANKIYFPHLHSENGRIVFYSLETGSYNTFSNGRYNIVEEAFCRTRQINYPHAWIEPSWSS